MDQLEYFAKVSQLVSGSLSSPRPMKYRSAYVTLTAQVFVPEYELADALDLKETAEQTKSEQLQDVVPEVLCYKFEEMARDRIDALFPTDEPLKLREVHIDMSTFR